ncbi:MAG TPA: hypothetical protein VGR56_05465 [Nitrososphaerales archaeon]|nr:hypothetical protein [Nitrososphaerales archaeon]
MPFPGITFKVNANELTMGPGTITVLENSFLFEANNHKNFGFDFSALRLVRIMEMDSFDVAYSLQGSIQKASFVTTTKYFRRNEGIEKDVASNPLEWELAFWKLHTITGAVVARMLVDRGGSPTEGFAPMSDEEFESHFDRASDIIRNLPSQKEIENGGVSGQELEELETRLTKSLLKLTDAWLMGNLSQRQREMVAVLDYLDDLTRYEHGWFHSTASDFHFEMTNQDYKENAEDWLIEEMKWGSNLREIIFAQKPAL